jgi:hypothetical protein
MSPTDKNPSNKNTVKQSLSQGCGCFSVFFMVFFVWVICTTITTYYSVDEVNATIIQSIQIVKTDLSARPSDIYIPIVSYEYQGTKYVDTLDYKANNADFFEIGSSIKTYINPENPQIAMDNSTDTFYFYSIFLIMAFLSFLMYKILKKEKKQATIIFKIS